LAPDHREQRESHGFRRLGYFSHFSSPVGVLSAPTVAGEGKASNGRALAMISAIASLIGLGSRRADRFVPSSISCCDPLDANQLAPMEKQNVVQMLQNFGRSFCG
jgi:hypothetical protein